MECAKEVIFITELALLCKNPTFYEVKKIFRKRLCALKVAYLISGSFYFSSNLQKRGAKSLPWDFLLWKAIWHHFFEDFEPKLKTFCYLATFKWVWSELFSLQFIHISYKNWLCIHWTYMLSRSWHFTLHRGGIYQFFVWWIHYTTRLDVKSIATYAPNFWGIICNSVVAIVYIPCIESTRQKTA